MASVATLAMVSTLASAGLSAYGQIQQQRAANFQAELDASTARTNAIIDQMNAEQTANALQMKAIDEKRAATHERALASQRAYRRKQEQDELIGRQRTVAAASGGGLEGSALKILEETAGEGDLQQRIELATGEERAIALENEAKMSLFDADNAKRFGGVQFKSGVAKSAGYSASKSNAGFYSAGATLLKAGAGAYEGYSSRQPMTRRYDPKWRDTRVYRY